jgi:type VI secretion system secreted protein VgrG
MADAPQTHKKVEGCDEIKYLAGDANGGAGVQNERIYAWSVHRSAVPGKYSLNDYDFTKPRAALESAAQDEPPHALSELEVYDYPSFDYETKSEGNKYARLRLEASQAYAVRVRGETNSRGISVGSTFQLADHPRADQNGEYLVTQATHRLRVGDYESGGGSGETSYTCSFEAIPSSEIFRLEAATPKPVVAGAQTALVVGPSNEEIWTDEHGRIKVQFPWDRVGKKDQASSCWVRVAQIWAGKNWGGVALPRIGQEVLVEFLDGDPDLPIVTGRVYNGDNKPPYALPANKTQTGMKSRSSPKGGTDNFNEIRFEDKKGSEQVFIQAEKDLELKVKNDESAEVGNDRARTVKRNETVTVDKDSKRTVKENETIDVGKNYLLKAGDQITLETGQAKIVMKKNGDITISGKTITISATDSVKIDAKNALTAEGKMKAAISGMEVKVDGKMKVAISSGLDMKVKGTMTKVEGTMLDLSGAAMAKLKGAITMIG